MIKKHAFFCPSTGNHQTRTHCTLAQHTEWTFWKGTRVYTHVDWLPIRYHAHSAVLVHAAVSVFVDVDPNTYNIDPALIEAKITAKYFVLFIICVFIGGVLNTVAWADKIKAQSLVAHYNHLFHHLFTHPNSTRITEK